MDKPLLTPPSNWEITEYANASNGYQLFTDAFIDLCDANAYGSYKNSSWDL